MPFTLSHAVLAPPLAKLTGDRLPIAALAIGTMVPDLFRLFTNANYDGSHQWSGLIFPNLVLGLVFCAIWYALYRPMLLIFFGLNKPLNIHSLNRFCGFILSLIVAILIGTATHLVWDGLTHVDFRTFAFKDLLMQPVQLLHKSYPLHRVLQIGLSALALPVLGWITAIICVTVAKTLYPTISKFMFIHCPCSRCLQAASVIFILLKALIQNNFRMICIAMSASPLIIFSAHF